MPRRTTTEQIDTLIGDIFASRQLDAPIRSLPAIYRAGREAAVAGQDVEAAVIAAVALAHDEGRR